MKSIPHHCLAIAMLTVFTVGCGSTADRFDVLDVESRMNETEQNLTADQSANYALCLSYIALCEQGISVCLDPSAAQSFASFCTNLVNRCDSTITKYCRPSPDGGLVVDGGVPQPQLPDVVVTALTFENGVFTATVTNQGDIATPAGVYVGVGYHADGIYRTWGSVMGPLAARASVSIGTNGGPYSLTQGSHTVMAFVDDINRFAESNEANNQRSITVQIGSPIADVPVLGPRPVAPTPLAKGTLFASPTGSGATCSELNPCDIWSAIQKARAGDVVFLRGGTYWVSKDINFYMTGTAASPVIFESYPGEHAVFDGGRNPKGADIALGVTGKFIQLRKITVQNMPGQGVWIGGTDNLLQGIHVHHSGLTGIQVYSPYNEFPYGAYGSRNIIRDCVSNDNFDQFNTISGFANGGNADGIGISSGADNRVEHCLSFHNSDDGIDTWRSTSSYVGYNISHSNGIADGNGNGIKAGGLPPSHGTLVEHCFSYSNQSAGFDFNGGAGVRFTQNTSWANERGFVLGPDTVVSRNIMSETAKTGVGIATDNSWQRAGAVSFMSTDPASRHFLVPLTDGSFKDIGALSGP